MNSGVTIIRTKFMSRRLDSSIALILLTLILVWASSHVLCCWINVRIEERYIGMVIDEGECCFYQSANAHFESLAQKAVSASVSFAGSWYETEATEDKSYLQTAGVIRRSVSIPDTEVSNSNGSMMTLATVYGHVATFPIAAPLLLFVLFAASRLYHLVRSRQDLIPVSVHDVQ
jgi:hypothetical protein